MVLSTPSKEINLINIGFTGSMSERRTKEVLLRSQWNSNLLTRNKGDIK